MAERSSRRRDERGFTLTETMVVLALMALATIPILQVLEGGVRSERNAVERVRALEDGAGALEWISADVRSSTSFSRLPVGVAAGSALLLHTTSSGADQLIEWRFTGDQLVRRELDAGGRVLTEASVLENLVVDADPAPIQLLDLRERVLDASAASTIDLTSCTALVRVRIQQLVAGTNRTHATDVAVRASRSSRVSC